MFVSFGNTESAVRDQAAAFVQGHYNLPFSFMERYVVGGSVAAVAESLAPFRDLGVEDFVISPMAADPSSFYEQACAVYDLLGVGA